MAADLNNFQIKSVAFENLACGYENKSCVEGVDFTLPMDVVTRLRGSSGSGKSVFLKMLAGLLLPNSGNYKINEQLVQEMSFEEFLPYRLNIGYAFDNGGLLNNKTLRENLILPLQYHKKFPEEENQKIVNELMNIFSLQSVANVRPFSVSGSQRKALCIARSFVMNPQFVILDEPTIGLGEAAKEALVALLKVRMRAQAVRYVVVTSDDQAFLRYFSLFDLEIKSNKSIGRVAA